MIASTALSDERVTAFEVWQLELPTISRREHGIGSIDGTVEIVILELTSESGAKGYGEASPWSVFTGSVEACYAALDRYIRPIVIGNRVGDVAAIMERARRAIVHCTEAKAALECALLDLAARLAGVPVWALLGGKCRDTIPLSCSLADPDFAADRSLVERLREDSVGIVKLKAGFRDHAFDITRLETLRREHPNLDVRVDFNQGLEAETAVNRVRDVAAFEPTFVEQPVAAHLYDLMAEIRNEIAVPLLADESVFGPEDMMRAVREGICDGVSIKVMKAGGLRRGMIVAGMAEAVGLSAYGGDMFESGLAHLAGVHMVAATPAVTLGCEFYQARYYLCEDILTEPFPIADGHVVVPDGLGLGIEPDLEKVRKYSVRHSLERAA